MATWPSSHSVIIPDGGNPAPSEARLNPSTAPAGTQVVQRLHVVLETLREEGGASTFSNLQRKTGLAKSTLHRLLNVLVAIDFASQDDDGRYLLGTGLIDLGKVASQVNPVGSALSEAMDRLSVATEDTIFFTQRQGSLGVCTHRREATGPIRNYVLHPGDTHPLGIGAGSLAILAALSPSAQVEVRRKNIGTFPNGSPIRVYEKNGQMEKVLSFARTHGYAVNPGLLEPSSWAVGVAVKNANGTVIGALSIASIKYRLNNERMPALVRMLKAEATTLQETLKTSPVPPATSNT